MCPVKILPVKSIRDADEYTIANEPVSSIDLMERAARACYEWLSSFTMQYRNFKVICGMGNNGGDGLAMARMLHEEGLNVEVFYVRHASQASIDNQVNFDRIANVPGLVVTEIFESDPVLEIEEGDVVIDALLGSGLNKPVSGFLAEVINQINRCNGFVISIDIPSGLFADISSSENKAIIEADYTLSFQIPKLAFFIPENDKYVGKWIILDIGLSSEFIKSADTSFFMSKKKDCISLFRERPRYSHKGSYGHALLIAGSLGKIGAAIMASKACLRAGAGLLTTHLPLTGMTAMHASLPETMVSLDPSETHFSALPDISNYNAIGIGPGIGMHDETQRQFKLLIQLARFPLVIDADALNILSENKTWLSFLPAGSILTPHPKEFERLTSKVDNHFNRLEILRTFATRFKVFVVLKGAYSAIASPDGSVYFNSTGNPGMATGGTGDVLTGIILGLLASGYTPMGACILGTWLHGKAGDIAAEKLTQPAMLASDIIENLGEAFKKITE